MATLLVALDLLNRPSPAGSQNRPQRQPTWQCQLDRIFVRQYDAPDATSVHTQLGLMVEFSAAPKVGESLQHGAQSLGSRFTSPSQSGFVKLQPVRPGVNKKRVRGHLAWWRFEDTDQVGYPEQIMAFESLAQLYFSGGGYMAGQKPMVLSDIGSQLVWPALRQVGDSGVALLENTTFTPVVFESAPAVPEIQIHEGADGSLSLTAATRHPALHGDVDLTFIGRYAHGVCWRDNDDQLHLARFERYAELTWQRLADEPAELQVPSDGRTTFIDEGIRAAVCIRRKYPHVAILILSQYVTGVYARELFAQGEGGIGYLLKENVLSLASLKSTLSRLVEGHTELDPEVVSALIAVRTDPLGALTLREREVLGLMAEDLTNKEIAEHSTTQLGTVEKQVASVFAKLGLSLEDGGHRRVVAVLTWLQNMGNMGS